MPIFGYLAIPHKGKIEKLCTELTALPYCEIFPAENKDVLVVVTATPNEIEEKLLQKRLIALDALQSLSMTFGHSDQQQPDITER